MTAQKEFLRDNILEMKVANIGFLLDRLGQDCHPLQFLRELTQNSIEAIERSGKSGQVVWDMDWVYSDLLGEKKLCIIDTGVGMTPDEMERFINQLSSSVQEQSFSGNYGVGAKVSAATRNHCGVVYLSWKNGVGAMIHLYRDPDTGKYGLRQWKRADGTYGHHVLIEDDVKPDLMKEDGTVVVLLGNSEDENTMIAKGVPSPSRWISKYLNTRYFRFPSMVTVRAREGWEYPSSDKKRNYLRTLSGQEAYLKKHAVCSGKKQLTDAIAHWWILKDEPAMTNNSGFVESVGHVAALYQNELYELATARSGMSKLQQFGILFGYRFVVIYVEPKAPEDKKITTNTARTLLLVDSEPLPWDEWASEFRENLPSEIDAFVQEKAAGAASTDHTKSIRERLKDILDLFKVSRYRSITGGRLLVDDSSLVAGGEPGTKKEASVRTGATRSGRRGGTAGNVYSAFEKKDGVPGEKVKPDLFPEVRWVTVSNGTREPGDIEDRGAKYLGDQNLLLINSDFRVFSDMTEFFVKQFGDRAELIEIVTDAVRQWFEQALVETIIGVQALKDSKEWTKEDLEKAVSQEALTSAVMQRYHVKVAVSKELGLKLGSRRLQKVV